MFSLSLINFSLYRFSAAFFSPSEHLWRCSNASVREKNFALPPSSSQVYQCHTLLIFILLFLGQLNKCIFNATVCKSLFCCSNASIKEDNFILTPSLHRFINAFICWFFTKPNTIRFYNWRCINCIIYIGFNVLISLQLLHCLLPSLCFMVGICFTCWLFF